MPLGKSVSVRTHGERHVAVCYGRQIKRTLDDDLSWRRRKKIVTSHDFRYAHRRIIHNRSERVARAVNIARQWKIAKRLRHILLVQSGEDIFKLNEGILRDAKPPAWRTDRRRFLPIGEASPARSWIEQLFSFVRSGLRRLHVLPAAHAWIHKSGGLQALKRGAVHFAPFGLHMLLVPVESEPTQFFDCFHSGSGLIAWMVEILHTENDATALRPRP